MTCNVCSKDWDGTVTYGGYSDKIVVHQHFVLRFPDNLPSDAGAPLLCAGITVYSPMKYYGMIEPGKHLGVAGLGGLGHVAAPLLGLLKMDGKLVTVGLPEKPLELPGRKLIGGSDFGGIKETQEMLDFCGEHNITADVEVIRLDDINIAMERLAKSDVRYRFVIDLASSLPAQ
nr:probable mannitol dehydrogenase [Ipomoea batatas]